jgi:ribosomal-protein-alanine N-acetyltransferase
MFRLYKLEDFAALYAIEEVCFQPPLRFGRRYMRSLVESENAATWIAEQDGEMAGFVIVDWMGEKDEEEPTSAYLQTIEVKQEWRGQGIGRELLRKAEGSAGAAGAELLWLHVDAENAAAIRMYEEHGYCAEGREEDYYARGRAALIYAKRLGDTG